MEDLLKNIDKMPMLLKLSLCMYIIPAGLNAMYDIGYMIGEASKHIIK